MFEFTIWLAAEPRFPFNISDTYSQINANFQIDDESAGSYLILVNSSHLDTYIYNMLNVVQTWSGIDFHQIEFTKGEQNTSHNYLL